MGRFSRAARIGDKIKSRCDIRLHTEHHNCPHNTSGNLTQGSNNVFINGIGAARLGDRCEYMSCEHGGSGKVTEGSGTVFINGKAAVRIKDAVTCQNHQCGEEGTVIEGSDNVFIGD